MHIYVIPRHLAISCNMEKYENRKNECHFLSSVLFVRSSNKFLSREMI